MRLQNYSILFCLSLLISSCTRPIDSDVDTPSIPLLSGMGEFFIPISTQNKMTQRYFNQGMVLYFGSEYENAGRSFREAIKRDEKCAICYWGLALTTAPHLEMAFETQNVDGNYAMQRAWDLRNGISNLEYELISSLKIRFAEGPLQSKSQGEKLYLAELKRLTAKYPEDSTILMLYIEGLMIKYAWNYWEPNGKAKPWTQEILTALNTVIKIDKTNPFAHHLYIHLLESSNRPEQALTSAKILPGLAPGVSHLVQTPARIYQRIGDYEAATLANKQAIEVDERTAAIFKNQNTSHYTPSPLNYYALWLSSMLESDTLTALYAARKTASLVDVKKMRQPEYSILQHLYITPIFALVNFERWREILMGPAPAPDLLYPNAIWHFALGTSYAKMNEARLAHTHLEKINNLRDQLIQENTKYKYSDSLIDILHVSALQLNAWIAETEGRIEHAIKLFQSAIHIENAMKTAEISLWIKSSNRELAQLLLKQKQFAPAELAFRNDLALHPKNEKGLIGLYQSLISLKKFEAAKEIEAQLDKNSILAE